MKIGITVCERDGATVCAAIASCERILIIETDIMRQTASFVRGDNGDALVRALIDEDCEAIVCAPMERRLFEPIAAACITRYDGEGLEWSEAVRSALQNRLPLIRDHIGASGYESHSHG